MGNGVWERKRCLDYMGMSEMMSDGIEERGTDVWRA